MNLTIVLTIIPNQISDYLTIKDLGNCALVSQVWKNLFDSDAIWESVAGQLAIKKTTTDLFKATNYKSLIKQQFLEIHKKFGKVFLEIFGGSKGFLNLPTTVGSYCFTDKNFSAPIVRGTLEGLNDQDFMLFRIKNNAYETINYEAFNVCTPSSTLFLKSMASKEELLICPLDNYPTAKILDRIKRLVKREPVGFIICDIFSAFEGLTNLPDGRSVLELC
jgi:hypothetical protein